jgi:hypothetical protein
LKIEATGSLLDMDRLIETRTTNQDIKIKVIEIIEIAKKDET